MNDLTTISKTLGMVDEHQKKRERYFPADAWASFDRVHERASASSMLSDAVMNAGVSSVTDGLVPDLTASVVRAVEQIEFGPGIADAVRELPEVRSAFDQMQFGPKVTELMKEHLGGPPFPDLSASLAKVTELPGMQDHGFLTSTVISAIEQAGIGDRALKAASVVTDGAWYERAAGMTAGSSLLDSVTRVVERDLTDFSQPVKAALAERQAWPKSPEPSFLGTSQALTEMIEGPNLDGLFRQFDEGRALFPVEPVRAEIAPLVLPFEAEPAEIIDLSPEGLAEESAKADARSNKQAAEELLKSEGLNHELGHLDCMAELLIRNDAQAREYAALAANKILKGLADHFWPGQKGADWGFRWENEDRRPIETKHSTNRIAAYLDFHLRAQLSSREHKYLEATLYFASDFAGAGHHVARPRRQALQNYNNLLMIIAAIGRARQVELGD